jgi:hypothetical protein
MLTQISYYKKLTAFAVLISFATQQLTYAIGCLAHNYVAQEVASQLENLEVDLYKILKDHWNDYLVGSDFPDTGFIGGATYGEITHWQPFVDAFIRHLHKNYPCPCEPRDRLIAFLMGIATHNQSDITAHWTYYNLVAEHDFPGDPDAWSKAHSYMDPGTDFYVIVNKQIFNHPLIWWVPVEDLVAIYQSMNHPVSSEEIIKANIIYYLAVGITETTIALPAYWYDKEVAVPWGMTNLETPDQPDKRIGAFPGMTNDSTTYLQSVWAQYKSNGKSNFTQKQPCPAAIRPYLPPSVSRLAKAYDQKLITVNQRTAGSLTLTPGAITVTQAR